MTIGSSRSGISSAYGHIPKRSKLNSFRYCRILAILLFCSLYGNPGRCQSDPLAVVDHFMEARPKEAKKLLIGEAVGHHFNARDLSDRDFYSTKLLAQYPTTAVVAITIQTPTYERDFYAHLTLSGTDWKIHAFRALALPGLFYEVMRLRAKMDTAELRQAYEGNIQTNRLIQKMMDSLAVVHQSVASGAAVQEQTYAEYLADIQRDSLTIASDRKLVAFFMDRKAAFEELNSRVRADYPSLDEGTRIGKDRYRDALTPLLLSSVSLSWLEVGAIVHYVIGGMIDNEVGYLYCDDPAQVPVMKDNGYIMIRKIAEGWYLYKTT